MTLAASRSQWNALAALGVSAVLAVAALFAWRWTGELDGAGPQSEVAIDTNTPEPTVVAAAAPSPADLLEAPESIERTTVAASPAAAPIERASAVRPTQEEKKKRPRKKRAEKKGAADEVMIQGPHPQMKITPIIDAYAVPGLNLGVPMTLSTVPMAGDVGMSHSVRGLINESPTLSFPYRRANPLFDSGSFVVDHPGALRVTLSTHLMRWSSSGSDLVAAPTVKLKPVELHIALGRVPPREGRHAKGASQLQGTAYLVSIDSNQEIQVLDSISQGSGSRKSATLRYGKTAGKTYVIGIPEVASSAADLIDITSAVADQPRDGERLVLPTGLRGRQPAPVTLEVIDPFGSPVKGAEVRALVDQNYVVLRDRSSLPVSIGGFAFVKDPGDASGQVVSGGEARRLGLGLVRQLVQDETGNNGQVTLRGVHRQVSTFEVKSPFGDTAVVEFPLTATEAPQLTVAPLAAIEVHCPTIWRTDDAGREAWARAKVKLSGRSKMLPFSKADKQARGPRRFLVPANAKVRITCQAKGSPKMSGEIIGPGQRQVTTHFPKPAD